MEHLHSHVAFQKAQPHGNCSFIHSLHAFQWQLCQRMLTSLQWRLLFRLFPGIHCRNSFLQHANCKRQLKITFACGPSQHSFEEPISTLRWHSGEPVIHGPGRSASRLGGLLHDGLNLLHPLQLRGDPFLHQPVVQLAHPRPQVLKKPVTGITQGELVCTTDSHDSRGVAARKA